MLLCDFFPGLLDFWFFGPIRELEQELDITLWAVPGAKDG